MLYYYYRTKKHKKKKRRNSGSDGEMSPIEKMKQRRSSDEAIPGVSFTLILLMLSCLVCYRKRQCGLRRACNTRNFLQENTSKIFFVSDYSDSSSYFLSCLCFLAQLPASSNQQFISFCHQTSFNTGSVLYSKKTI